MKKNLLDNTKHRCKSCKKKYDSCNNVVGETTAIKCFSTGRIFKIRRDSSCQTKNVIYVAYCLNAQKQDLVQLYLGKHVKGNYKLRIKNDMKSSKIVRNCAKRTILDRYTCHRTQGVIWDP